MFLINPPFVEISPAFSNIFAFYFEVGFRVFSPRGKFMPSDLSSPTWNSCHITQTQMAMVAFHLEDSFVFSETNAVKEVDSAVGFASYPHPPPSMATSQLIPKLFLPSRFEVDTSLFIFISAVFLPSCVCFEMSAKNCLNNSKTFAIQTDLC